MSSPTERIKVPTNGKGPHPEDANGLAPVPPEPDETTYTFTPTQMAVGFGILASLIVLVVGWLRRRGRSNARGPFGRR